MAAAVAERSLVGELSLVDCLDGLLWQKDGHVTLVYRVEGWHEPALDDAQFDSLAFMAEHVWSGLPEETSFQFHVLVDHLGGLKLIDGALPAILDDQPTLQLLEEFRAARHNELAHGLVQGRRHYVAATFMPSAFRAAGWWASLIGAFGRQPWSRVGSGDR